MPSGELQTVTGRCKCGSQYEVTASPQYIALYEKDFWRQHKGPTHGPEEPLPDPGEQGALL